MKFLLCAALLVYAGHASAQERAPGDLGKASSRTRNTVLPSGVLHGELLHATASATAAREVLAKDTIIAPGGSAAFEWLSDIGGSDQVHLSITTLGDPSSRLTKVRIGVAFAAPGDWYVLSDMILCSSFYFFDHGGATVPVYGPYMKLVVFNDGTAPVTITQLAAYAVAR